MSEPIKAGDLVRVSSSHCKGFENEALGVIFVVDQLRQLRKPWCSHCGELLPSTIAAEGGDEWSVPLQFLTKVPPLGDLEDVKQNEEITA